MSDELLIDNGDILWRLNTDGKPDADATARYYCGLYRLARAAAVRSFAECDQLRDEIAKQKRETEHWQRMYECAQDDANGIGRVDGDTMQDFICWLCAHESDIKNEIDDFGCLREFFKQLIGREPGSIIREEPW